MKWARKIERSKRNAAEAGQADSNHDRDHDRKVIDEEIRRLPKAYRAAVLLCDPSSDFAGLGPISILSLAFRPDVSVTGPRSTTLRAEVRLSTINAAPGTASATFADNVGPDETLVYNATFEFATQGVTNPGQPHSFDYVFNFSKPFDYDPRQGNLLVDFTFEPPYAGTFPSTDAQSGATLVHGLVAPNASATVATNLRTERPVFQFTYVPEPPTAVPATAGLICLGVFALQRSNRRLRWRPK